MKTKLMVFVGLLLVFPILISAQNWSLKSGLPGNNERHHPVTWAINGYGYAVTGTTQAQQTTNDFFKYDPATDSWTQLGDFPGQARSFAIGGEYQGKGYIGFGSSTAAYLKDLWSYDAQTQTWTQLASCPCVGRQHPAFTINQQLGKIYVGLGNNSLNLGDWWEYDIATDTWSQKADFPGTDRHHPYQFSIGNYTYVGFGDDHISNYATEDFYRYDPATNTWLSVADAPDGIGRIAGSQFEYGGYGFAVDGDGAYHSPTNPSIFWRYNPTTDQWDVLPPHTGVSLWAPESFIIDGVLYLLGGVDRSTTNYFFFEDMWTIDLNNLGTKTMESPGLSVELYPNPVQNKLNIKIQNAESQYIVRITNMLGQEVMKQTLNPMALRLDVSTLNKGVYVLNLKAENGKAKRIKFIKN